MITDAEVLSMLRGINNKMFLFTYYLANGILAYYKKEIPKAVELLALAEENAVGAVGMMTNSQYRFYYSLALLAQVAQSSSSIGVTTPAMTDAQRTQALAQVGRNQALLHKWAQHAPANYHHKYLLVEAQRMVLRGKHSRAMDLFDEAIEGAHEGGFLHEEALARELAADFYFLRSTLTLIVCVVCRVSCVCRVCVCVMCDVCVTEDHL
jgi:hypothetical protein